MKNPVQGLTTSGSEHPRTEFYEFEYMENDT